MYRNGTATWLLLSITNVLAAFFGKKKKTRSLPHLENEHQWSMNDFWLCI
jgi:hypothetical protein